MVAVARFILVIVWHRLTGRSTRYHNLDVGYYTSRIDNIRNTHNHVRQPEALDCTITLT